MKQAMFKIRNLLLIMLLLPAISGCGRDLSPDMYTSDSTMNIVLNGTLLSKRDVTIRESERLGDNSTGALVGGAAGLGIAAHNSDNIPLIVGGAIVGGVAGALTERALGSSKGTEYIVQVDRSMLRDDYYEGSRLLRNAIAAARSTGFITIVQAKDGHAKNPVMNEGDDVLVILSEKRTRLIPAKYPTTSTQK